MDTLKYDKSHILESRQEALHLLFSTLDLTKVSFVGGIADYINLRGKYVMPINDIDLVFRDEEDLKALAQVLPLKRFESKYATDTNIVYVTNFEHKTAPIHIDCFRQHTIYNRPTSTSDLLGHQVNHHSFKGMKQFHNEHVELMSSDSKLHEYEWKRLYKHSRKAALYNLICYKRDKQELVAV